LTNSGSHWTDEQWMEDVIRHYQDGYRFGKRDGLLEASHILGDAVHNAILHDRDTISIDELLEIADKFTQNKEDNTDD
jgi:hypothetical protein